MVGGKRTEQTEIKKNKYGTDEERMCLYQHDAILPLQQTALITRSILFVLVGIEIKASQFASRELFKLNGQIRQHCPQIHLTC